jgi:hypothetical protein
MRIKILASALADLSWDRHGNVSTENQIRVIVTLRGCRCVWGGADLGVHISPHRVVLECIGGQRTGNGIGQLTVLG